MPGHYPPRCQGNRHVAEVQLEGAASKLKVTLVAIQLRGGIVHYSICLANALVQHVPVRVVIPEGAQTAGYAPEVELVPVAMPMECSWRELRIAPRRLAELPRFLQALDGGGDDEIVHFLNRHEYLTLAAPLVRRRLVVTLHDPHPHQGEASLRKLLANWTLRRHAREVFVYGELLKQHLVEQGVRPGKITVVPHGTFGSFTQCDLPPDATPTGLFFGRIAPYKGLEILLQAAPLIRRQVPAFRLIVAGEGDLTPYRQLLDCELGTGQCELINRFLSDAEMAELLARSSVVLLPYREATQSGVVPLAYGASRPVIASAVGALPEIIEHGRTGLLVPANDPETLAAAAVQLLQDPQRARCLAEAGAAYARENLSWDAIAQTTLDVYARVAGRAQQGKEQ